MTAAALLDAMDKVRMIRAGSLRCVLPLALGETVIADDVSEAEVRDALARSGVPRVIESLTLFESPHDRVRGPARVPPPR